MTGAKDSRSFAGSEDELSGKAIASIITTVTFAVIALLVAVPGAYIAQRVYQKRVRQTTTY